MTRIVPLLSAAAAAAFLTFGGAAAFAMATGGDGNGGHPGAGPNGPSAGPTGPSGGPNGPSAGNTGGPASAAPRVAGCDFRADQMDLNGPARRSFLWRCEQNGVL